MWFLVESHKKTFKHQEMLSNKSELQSLHYSQTLLKTISQNFVEKMNWGLLSAHIPLCKLNNRLIKNHNKNPGKYNELNIPAEYCLL